MIIQDVGKAPFYQVSGADKKTKSYIQYTIKDTHRFYEDGFWLIHKNFVVPTAQIEYMTTGDLVYGSLPGQLQMEIAHGKEGWVRGQPSTAVIDQSAWGELFLLPTAPIFVVEAVWRALAKKHHPDAGGDQEMFTTFLKSYNKIKETFE